MSRQINGKLTRYEIVLIILKGLSFYIYPDNLYLNLTYCWPRATIPSGEREEAVLAYNKG